MSKNKPNPHAEHRNRLKQRYLRENLDNFELHNVLELMLFFGIPLKDTNETAHALLDNFGGFSETLDADYRELLEVKGIGEHAATMIRLFADVARIYMIDKAKDIKALDNMEALIEFFTPKYIAVKEELIYMAGLDNSGKIIDCKLMAKGIQGKVIMPIQDIVREAIHQKAPNIVISHNHPTGPPLPSRDDINSTVQLLEACCSMNIRLLDHIIIGKQSDYASLRESQYVDFDKKY